MIPVFEDLIQITLNTNLIFLDDGESDTLEKLREFEEDREKDREKLKKEAVSKLHGDIPNPGGE